MNECPVCGATLIVERDAIDTILCAWCRFFFHGTTELRTVSNSEVVGLESLLKYHHSEQRVIRAAQEKVWHDQTA